MIRTGQELLSDLYDAVLGEDHDATDRALLTGDEDRIIRWLAKWDDFTVDAVVSLLERVRREERAA